ncbi:P-loop containing nucleoside triphosphate hydrolase protein [Phyllosticta citriasiana]|uniref:RNA helicase n=1 Tax=Phyllosticta citriasiana TaxID=595635 RepID=A0ABR1KEM7_9PEZI
MASSRIPPSHRRSRSPAIRSEHELWPGWANNTSSASVIEEDQRSYDEQSLVTDTPDAATDSQAFCGARPEELAGWNGFNLPEYVLANLNRLRFKKPTAAQGELLRILTKRRFNALVASSNKSGRTVGACLSAVVFAQVRVQRGRQCSGSRGRTPAAIILFPSRERALKAHSVVQDLVQGGQLKVARVVGGSPLEPQLKQLRMGCDVLVATPGRLIEVASRYCQSIETELFVMDRADTLLGNFFREDLEELWRKDVVDENTIFACLCKAYSERLEDEVVDFVDDDESLLVSTVALSTKANIRMHRAGMKFQPASGGALDIVIIKEAITVGRRMGKIMVFANNRRQVERLLSKLRDAEGLVVLRGNYTNMERREALHHCESGDTKVIIATDQSANGMKISNIGLVIHAHLPQKAMRGQLDSPFVRFLSRNARAARSGTPGHSISFYRKEDYHLFEDLANHLVRSGQQEMNRVAILNLSESGATIIPSQPWRQHFLT